MLDTDILAALTATLQQHIWIVGVNETDLPFFTSDHPVVRIPHLKDAVLSLSGLRSPGIEIAFPLGPKYILMLCERTVHNAAVNLDRKRLSMTRDNLTYYNSHQVRQSTRFVYSRTSSFDLRREMLLQDPRLSEIDRPRVIVE